MLTAGPGNGSLDEPSCAVIAGGGQPVPERCILLLEKGTKQDQSGELRG